MAIKIVTQLAPARNSIPYFPFRLDLQQVLQSSEPSERVTIEYWLDPGHSIHFDGQVKTGESRQQAVASTETPVRDRVTLVRGLGRDADVIVLHQNLVDGTGRRFVDFDQTFIQVSQ